MPIVFDAHVHLYPRHDEGLLFSVVLKELGQLALGAARAIILTERSECARFSGMLEKKDPPAGFTLERCDDISVNAISDDGAERLLIIAGRQIATAERLEVLSLFSDARVPDGLVLKDTLVAVNEKGGLPVLTWAPGKWSGARSALVRSALEDKTCRVNCVCDTTLRPIGWPEPSLFGVVRQGGGLVLAGTDPLPIAGEEMQAGKFGVLLDAPELDGANITGNAVRAALTKSGANVKIVGSRNDPFSWALRYGRFMLLER